MENPAVTQGSKLLKALGNKKRLEVMYILREGEQKVGDLEKSSVSASPLCRSIWRFCGRPASSIPGGRRRPFTIRLKTTTPCGC